MSSRQPLAVRGGTATGNEPDLSARQNVLYAAFTLSGGDVQRLRSAVERAYRNAYSTTIARELQAAGCGAERPLADVRTNRPRGQEAQALEAMIERDVDSIVSTFNRELKNQVQRLTRQHPDWSRQQFRSELEAWQARRLEIKNRTIVTATRGNAGEYARQRFVEKNGLQSAQYEWSARPPIVANSHPECVRRVRAGKVPWSVAKGWQRPHPNCRHVVKRVTSVKVNCDTAWRG